MPRRVHQLIVVKPLSHEVGENIADAEYQTLLFYLLSIQRFVEEGRTIIFAPDTVCGRETARIAATIFKTKGFHIESALDSAEPHVPIAKDEDKMFAFLQQHERKYDNLVVITQFGGRARESVITTYNLRKKVNWEVALSMFVGEHEIIEY